MNSLRSFHWPPAAFAMESSIRMARNRLSSFFQSAICLRSLPVENRTSSLEIGGAPSFFPTAVTVNVAVPDAAALVWAWAVPTTTNRSAPRNTPSFPIVPWCFMLVLLFPSSLYLIPLSLDAEMSLLAYTTSAMKNPAISGCGRGPRASTVTNSASVFHHPSWVPHAYATLLQDVFHNLISRFCGPRELRRCGLVPWFVDLQTVARFAGGLRRLVGPASVVDGVCRPFADRRMVFRLLSARPALQLSPFHGHGLPGVPLLR